MTFVNGRRGLAVFFSVIFIFQFRVLAQDESVIEEGAPRPDVNGLFDDQGLQPIDEGQIQRPPTDPLIEEDRDIFRNDAPPAIDRPSRMNRRGSSSNDGSINRGKGLNFPIKTPPRSEKVRMDFIQVEIEEIVKFFAEQMKIKFIYDPTILSGKITIISPDPVSLEEAYQAFLSAMEIRGYVVYPVNSYIKIEKVANARKSPVPLYLDSTPKDDSYVTRIITLRFLSVRDIRQPIRDLVSRSGGDVIEFAPTNTLIISDYAANIRRIIRILNILDVENFQEQIAVIPLKFASATDVAGKINQIFPTGQAAGGSAPASIGTRRSISTGGATNQSVVQKVVADDRTNSLIVLGSERGIEQVREFIKQIDVGMEGGDGGIFVYPLQNVKAEDISQTLASLTGQAKSNSKNPRNPTSAASNLPQNVQNILNERNAANNASAGASSATLFDGDVKITADNTTNALVIQASRRDYEVMKSIIQQLDVRRRQVFIESVILEASVGNTSEMGGQVSGPLFKTGALGGKATDVADGKASDQSAAAGGFGTLGQGTNPLALLQGLLGSTAITGLALGFRSGGTVPVSVVNPQTGETEERRIPLLSAIIRLSSNNDRLNVLSTPHILATANQPATISIGEEVPVQAASQATEAGLPIQTFNRLRVATELQITPQINAGDYLTLDIDQKVNEIKPEASTPNQPTTTTREAKTTAIVKDGQTIVIGGIMRDRSTVTQVKVPFLGDIPILGWLFKSRNKTVAKVNLLLFITPHIIRDTGDMNDIFFKKLKEREGFLSETGIEEKKGVPISGYTKEQLEFLDDDYVKNLKLYPLPNSLPKEAQKNANEEIPSPLAPVNSDSELPKIEIPGAPIVTPPDAPKNFGPVNTEVPAIVPPAPLVPNPIPDNLPTIAVPPRPRDVTPEDSMPLPLETTPQFNNLPSRPSEPTQVAPPPTGEPALPDLPPLEEIPAPNETPRPGQQGREGVIDLELETL